MVGNYRADCSREFATAKLLKRAHWIQHSNHIIARTAQNRLPRGCLDGIVINQQYRGRVGWGHLYLMLSHHSPDTPCPLVCPDASQRLFGGNTYCRMTHNLQCRYTWRSSYCLKSIRSPDQASNPTKISFTTCPQVVLPVKDALRQAKGRWIGLLFALKQGSRTK